MNSTEAMRIYKHDIAGKFKDISTAIKALDENSFNDPEAREIFYAVHEVILKMVKTSRETISHKLNQEILLFVTNAAPDINLPKLQIEGVNLRYIEDNSTIMYLYSKTENEGSLDVHIGVLKILLPIKFVEYEEETRKVTKFFKNNRLEL